MNLQTATLGGGCFWCLEAIFQRTKGVKKVESGYSGGKTESPTYHEIHESNDGHAEVIQITFDTEVISYEEILNIFWHFHDPTTLNRQGADVGPAYRSVIFYHDEAQKKIAEESMHAMDASATYPNPIVTTIEPFTAFYKAEGYHQNYYEDNKNAPYCQIVISPKVTKFREKFNEYYSM